MHLVEAIDPNRIPWYIVSLLGRATDEETKQNLSAQCHLNGAQAMHSFVDNYYYQTLRTWDVAHCGPNRI